MRGRLTDRQTEIHADRDRDRLDTSILCQGKREGVCVCEKETDRQTCGGKDSQIGRMGDRKTARQWQA